MIRNVTNNINDALDENRRNGGEKSYHIYPEINIK